MEYCSNCHQYYERGTKICRYCKEALEILGPEGPGNEWIATYTGKHHYKGAIRQQLESAGVMCLEPDEDDNHPGSPDYKGLPEFGRLLVRL